MGLVPVAFGCAGRKGNVDVGIWGLGGGQHARHLCVRHKVVAAIGVATAINDIPPQQALRNHGVLPGDALAMGAVHPHKNVAPEPDAAEADSLPQSLRRGRESSRDVLSEMRFGMTTVETHARVWSCF